MMRSFSYKLLVTKAENQIQPKKWVDTKLLFTVVNEATLISYATFANQCTYCDSDVSVAQYQDFINVAQQGMNISISKGKKEQKP